MKQALLPLLSILLLLAGVWYWILDREVPVNLVSYSSDDEVIAMLSPTATKQEIWSAVAHFEKDLDRVKSKPRSYCYYAAFISMMPLYQKSPIDKQASSTLAAAVFTNITETYPNQGLSVLFEAIALLRSPEFLRLDEKSFLRLNTAWTKIEEDQDDGELHRLNKEALLILVQFLPMFEKTYVDRNKVKLNVESISKKAKALHEALMAES